MDALMQHCWQLVPIHELPWLLTCNVQHPGSVVVRRFAAMHGEYPIQDEGGVGQLVPGTAIVLIQEVLQLVCMCSGWGKSQQG